LEAVFFTVPTISFGVLYCFFVIRHDRRRILHFNITEHPTSGWIIQQLREAFPFGASPRFLIHDCDAKYGTEVPAAIRALKINAMRTSFESPWQNESPSAGWGAVAASCSTMSLVSMSGT
jgi:putative transposase